LDGELRTGTAEQLGMPSASVDAVVSTLVLCSVPSVAAVLKEILRVLKPGGRFVFIEHVAAPRGTMLRFGQQFVRPLSICFADGCHPDRETGEAIEAAGFGEVKLERFRAPLWLASPHVAGVAVR
jgi:ubiquinone/menaquinone biosynthesis C-methylase UbiE